MVFDTTDANKWVIDSDGKRQGPFTFDELKALLESRQVKLTDRVNTMNLTGNWIPLQDLLKGASHNEGEVDPTISLFDALQVAKQKAAQRRIEQGPSAEDFVDVSRSAPGTPVWVKAIGALLFLILLVEVIRLLPEKNPTDAFSKARTIAPASDGANLKSTTPPPSTIKPALTSAQAQAAKTALLEKEKREREERDRKAREEREERERADREREEREREEREREEAVRAREQRDADFEDSAPIPEDAGPGGINHNRVPTSPDGEPLAPGNNPPDPPID